MASILVAMAENRGLPLRNRMMLVGSRKSKVEQLAGRVTVDLRQEENDKILFPNGIGRQPSEFV
jgi:hypothetical protein